MSEGLGECPLIQFAENFFNLVIHPLEKQGINFWWLDWQQGT